MIKDFLKTNAPILAIAAVLAVCAAVPKEAMADPKWEHRIDYKRYKAQCLSDLKVNRFRLYGRTRVMEMCKEYAKLRVNKEYYSH